MTPEQLQAAYFKGHGPVYPDGDFMGRLAEAHLAGLAEVAHQQAEEDILTAAWAIHDVGLPSDERNLERRSLAARAVATAIRAQFRPTND